jgi:hypothetical protein
MSKHQSKSGTRCISKHSHGKRPRVSKANRTGGCAPISANLRGGSGRFVVTDRDSAEQMSAPGEDVLFDLRNGRNETLRVTPDGSRGVISSEPFVRASRVGDEPPFVMQSIHVGAPYPGQYVPMSNGVHASIGPHGIALTIMIDQPTARELGAVQRGMLSMRLLTAPNTMMFLARLGDSPWMEAPFSVHRLPEEARITPPAPPEGYGWLVRLVVIDSRTGLVRVLRVLALTRAFSIAVLGEYLQQKANKADETAHGREVADMQRLPTAVLAERASLRFAQGADAN